jgi:hypothetical protein
MDRPPPTIDGALVLSYADTSGIAKTDACTFREANQVQEEFAALAIAQYAGASDCYLFLCDAHWETLNDSDHRDVVEAKAFAESLYPGISERWQSLPAAGVI